MNNFAKIINERWLSGMNNLCTRIETERYIFDDAVYSKYHTHETTAFCKGVSFGLHLACTMVEGSSNSVYDNCFNVIVSDSENEIGGEDDEK